MAKKAVSGIMLALLSIGMLSLAFNIQSTRAQTIAKLYVDPPVVYALPGESFTVDVMIADVVDLYSWQVNMSFNPDVLTFVNVAEGDFLANQPEGTDGPYIATGVGWALFSVLTRGAYPGVNGSGTLATVEFNVEALGESVLNITNSMTKLIEINLPPIPPGEQQFELIPYTAENGYFFGVSHEIAIVKVSPPTSTALVGETFTVNITITNVLNLYGWQFNLTFNPSVLQVISVVEGPFLSRLNHTAWSTPHIDNSAGHVMASASFLPPYPPYGADGNGTLASVTFQVDSYGQTLLAFDEISTLLRTFVGDEVLPIERETLDGYFSTEETDAVPFHYQTTDYYCGPACLEMVFDYYGEDINQTEIAEVARTHPYTTYTDELRRAAHFSNISTSSGTEMPEDITGYTLRQMGYAAFEGGLTIDQLKALIDQDYPVILLMWYSTNHVSGHYRVATSYNDTHFILHDPWNNIAWGGPYGGPDLAFNYATFLDLWSYSGYWALYVSPWNMELSIPSNIQRGDTFTIETTINYPCPTPFPTSTYPASLCKATIALPAGLSLAPGEIYTKALGTMQAGSWAVVSWNVEAEAIGDYIISIDGEGKVTGQVWAHDSFPSYSYTDRIGASATYGIKVLPRHDIAVVDVLPLKTVVGQSCDMSINVTVENQGDSTETFNVVGYANTAIIATFTNLILASGSSTTITLTWNTTDFAKGDYTISAEATSVQGENDKTDNTCTDGTVLVTIVGDIDGDGDVDYDDFIVLAGGYGSHIGQPAYDPVADIDGDGDVDYDDFILLAGNYGQKWS